MARERITIEGMGCDHCINAVRDALNELGVDIHEVEIGNAEISFGPSIDRERIDAAITEAGYRPIEHEAIG